MNRYGFTLVEIAAVLAILMVIIAISGAFSGITTGKSDLRDATTQAVDTLRRAQWQTIHGEEDDVWGAHFETTKFVLFKGVSYSAVDPNNVVTDLKGEIEVSSVSLTGGGSEVLFSTPFGDTTTDGTITFLNTVSNETSTVTVNTVGMIDRD